MVVRAKPDRGAWAAAKASDVGGGVVAALVSRLLPFAARLQQPPRPSPRRALHSQGQLHWEDNRGRSVQQIAGYPNAWSAALHGLHGLPTVNLLTCIILHGWPSRFMPICHIPPGPWSCLCLSRCPPAGGTLFSQLVRGSKRPLLRLPLLS